MKIKDYIKLISGKNFSQVLEYFEQYGSKSSKTKLVVSINPEIIMLARKDKEFEDILKSADLALNDGVGVTFAARLLGLVPAERISGVDLVQKICERIAKKPITVGFLGGKGNTAEKTAERLSEQYPSLKVAFSIEEPASNLKSMDCDILFVAFGSPKQEKWIAAHLEGLPAGVVMGVGGSFDFISGKVRRAPAWMRRIGLEWLFRLIVQPWRIKRQLSLIKFLFLVILRK